MSESQDRVGHELDLRQDGLLVDPRALGTPDDQAYQAHQLRLRGVSWTKVAQACGYPNLKAAEVSVRTWLQRSALDLSAERRAEALQLQQDRIEALIHTQWDKAEAGDTKAADFCLRAVGQLARLFGLETLHEKQGQSTKTIVIAGNSEEYTAALKAIAEE